MQQVSEIRKIDSTANPAPLGLAAFGLTTALLNLHNAGLYGLDTMIFAMGIFSGGLTQVMVGLMEWKKNNTFGTTAFTSYGIFWICLVGLLVFPKLGIGEAPSDASMASFLGLWGIFSIFLFIGTFKLNRALQIVFAGVVLLFGLLFLAKVTGSHTIHTIAGYEGVFCGLSALYTGMAQVINELYKKTILPLG